VPSEGHVVVVGLGNVGNRTLAGLARAGVPAAAVDVEPRADRRDGEKTRAVIVVGDAREREVLERARIGTARAVVAVTGSDAVNLGVALLSRKLNPKIRTVVRLFDAGLAEKVQAGLDVDVAMGSARVAAPMFVASALEEDVCAAVFFDGTLHILKRRGTGFDWTRRGTGAGGRGPTA